MPMTESTNKTAKNESTTIKILRTRDPYSLSFWYGNLARYSRPKQSTRSSHESGTRRTTQTLPRCVQE
jgi:hypothetical protein